MNPLAVAAALSGQRPPSLPHVAHGVKKLLLTIEDTFPLYADLKIL
jgi:hypothetical protein